MSQAGYAPKAAIQKLENVALLMHISWRMRRPATRTGGEVICPLYPKHICARSSKTLVDGTTTLSRNVRHESPIYATQYLRSTQSSSAPLRKIKTSLTLKKKKSHALSFPFPVTLYIPHQNRHAQQLHIFDS